MLLAELSFPVRKHQSTSHLSSRVSAHLENSGSLVLWSDSTVAKWCNRSRITSCVGFPAVSWRSDSYERVSTWSQSCIQHPGSLCVLGLPPSQSCYLLTSMHPPQPGHQKRSHQRVRLRHFAPHLVHAQGSFEMCGISSDSSRMAPAFIDQTIDSPFVVMACMRLTLVKGCSKSMIPSWFTLLLMVTVVVPEGLAEQCEWELAALTGPEIYTWL